VTPESSPGQPGRSGGTDPDRVREDVAGLADLVADGIDVDGQVVRVAESTWAIYGHACYEGGLIVGEYADAEDAAAVLDAAPRRAPDLGGPIV
jgi:hypothetical protein